MTWRHLANPSPNLSFTMGCSYCLESMHHALPPSLSLLLQVSAGNKHFPQGTLSWSTPCHHHGTVRKFPLTPPFFPIGKMARCIIENWKQKKSKILRFSDLEWTLDSPAPCEANEETEVQTGKVIYQRPHSSSDALQEVEISTQTGLHKKRIYWFMSLNSPEAYLDLDKIWSRAPMMRFRPLSLSYCGTKMGLKTSQRCMIPPWILFPQ